MEDELTKVIKIVLNSEKKQYNLYNPEDVKVIIEVMNINLRMYSRFIDKGIKPNYIYLEELDIIE